MVAPERCVRWVKNLHGDFEVVIKIGREEVRIKHECRMRPGDNMAQPLFIIVMQLVAEDIIAHLKKVGVDLLKIKYSIDDNGVLRSHSKNDMEAVIRYVINMLMHVDDGASLFNDRNSLTLVRRITCEVMVKLGLTTHVGCNGKNSNNV